MRPGALFADRFQIETRAGSGGMSAVFRAVDRAGGGGRRVALKVLLPGEWSAQGTGGPDRFEREAKILADLEHPAIVRYVAHGTTGDGERWLAMEWVQGENLAERLAHAPLSVRESVEIARQVADALGAAHARGVVHRDIKPSNLLLAGGRPDSVKVLDFGIARRHGGPEPATRTGTRLGTVGYMAPEQARGEREVGARADVYALGCVLFECLTGRPPYVGANETAIFAKILLDDPPLASEIRADLPPAVVEVVAWMLSKAPELRPRDGAEIAAELASLVDLPSGAAVPPTHRAVLGREERRLFSVVLAGGPDGLEDDDMLPTLPAGPGPRARIERLHAAVAAQGAKLERLPGGTLLVTVPGGGEATDQAIRAARAALAVQAILPETPVALSTGRAEAAGRRSVSEAIDRVAHLLAGAVPGGAREVRIDDVTAGLIGPLFDVSGSEGATLLLRGERTGTLLGRPTPFVGREPEIGLLVSLFEMCVDEPVARAVVVTGSPGIGKTRLAQELVTRVVDRKSSAEVWVARGDPVGAGSPFALLAQAVRGACGIHESEPIAVRRARLEARVSRHVASADRTRVLHRLGDLVGSPFAEEESRIRTARHDPIRMGQEMRQSLLDWLRAECDAHPVVFILEDLHRGDQPTVRFLDEALLVLADRPLLVIALGRTEVHDVFPRLFADRPVQEVRLGELTPRPCARLVREILGPDAAEDVVARIVRQSAGNPFYLEELLRAESAGRGHETPGTVLAMVQARLEGLPSELRRVLRAASVFGVVFWRGGVAKLCGDVADTEIAELCDREVLERRTAGRFAGEDELAFRHDLLREAAYAMLTESDRKLGHELAAEWLEAAGEPDPLVLAEHLERAGKPDRASQKRAELPAPQ